MSFHDADHERWHDATGAYVLHALSGEERAGFEEHLAECSACREEIAALRVAAHALPMSAAPVEPSPALKARVMAEVEREASLLAAAGASADEPVRDRRARWSWPRLLPATAVAVATALVVAVVFVGRDRTEIIPAAMDRAQVAPGSRGELRVRDGSATLVVSGLRRPQTGRVYQVWIKRRGRAPEPTSALFVPRVDGTAVTGVPADLGNGDGVLVTSEPSGGSQTPTRAPLLSASRS